MDEVTAELRRLNPRVPEAKIAIAANLVADYRHASANVREHGTVSLHPRTGEPIANPYCAVRDRSAKQLLDLHVQLGDLLSHT